MRDGAQAVCVDFDGVLHRYSRGWHDGSCYDPPVQGAFEALREIRRRGYRIVVYSARLDGDRGWQAAAMREWFERHGGRDLLRGITFEPKPSAIAYIDDRALPFREWGRALGALPAYDRMLPVDFAEAFPAGL